MSSNETEGRIKVGITCGDINGIGMEVIMKSFLDNRMHQLCTPVIYANAKHVSHQRKHFNLNEFNYTTVKNSSEIILRKTNVINCWEEDVQPEFGISSQAAGKLALKSIEQALKDLEEKKIDVLVTAPINKHNMQSPEFPFSGHTEYLSARFNASNHLMILVSESMKVAVVTEHVPVKDIIQHLTIEKIVAKLRVLNHSLKRDFSIRKPKIAVLGLNPHAGDNGVIGREEIDIIIPAIKKAGEENCFVFGPYSADGFFGSNAYRKFDAVLAMYHDQGLVPFKTLSFSTGVNFTAGLPIVRTSPDHGTAYDIAGKNSADEESFRKAVYLSLDVLRKREEFDSINKNPLEFSKLQGKEN